MGLVSPPAVSEFAPIRSGTRMLLFIIQFCPHERPTASNSRNSGPVFTDLHCVYHAPEAWRSWETRFHFLLVVSHTPILLRHWILNWPSVVLPSFVTSLLGPSTRCSTKKAICSTSLGAMLGQLECCISGRARSQFRDVDLNAALVLNATALRIMVPSAIFSNCTSMRNFWPSSEFATGTLETLVRTLKHGLAAN